MSGSFPNFQNQAAGAIPVWIALGPGGSSAAPFAFQQTVTESAAPLAANAATQGFSVAALPTNTGTVYVGPSGVTTSTGYPLPAGQSVHFAVSNTDLIYIIGTNTSDKVGVAGN